jgi:hypothetical protein
MVGKSRVLWIEDGKVEKSRGKSAVLRGFEWGLKKFEMDDDRHRKSSGVIFGNEFI